jgi:hypothetical protein
MQRQILPLGRHMSHVSGMNHTVRRLLWSTTHELGRQTESRHVIRKAFSLGLLGITRIGASWALCLELISRMQDLFEFWMHAYVNKHEVAERAFNHPRVHLCVHAGVFTYVWYSSSHSLHACMCMCVYVHMCTHVHIDGCSMYVFVHANTHMHQLKSYGRACQTKATQ